MFRREQGRTHSPNTAPLSIGAARVPGNAESDQHPHGFWKQAISLDENLARRFQSAMRQKLRSPVEQIGLDRIEFGGALVFADCLQRIAGFFFEIGELMVKSCVLEDSSDCIAQGGLGLSSRRRNRMFGRFFAQGERRFGQRFGGAQRGI